MERIDNSLPDAHNWLYNDPIRHVFEDDFPTQGLLDGLYTVLLGEWTTEHPLMWLHESWDSNDTDEDLLDFSDWGKWRIE